MFLNDKQLTELVKRNPRVFDGLDLDREPFSKGSFIQPASVDLTIGAVYVPGAAAETLGSTDKPLEKLSLAQGETAVVETRETCALPPEIGAIGFPPSSVSAQGLLMTNPGHVDPGYQGSLSFTVINMGKKPFPLAKGDRIVTLLLFRLEEAVRRPYGPGGAIKPELLEGLSKEFLDVSEKARAAADRAEAKTRRRELWAPLIGGLLVAVLTLGGTFLTVIESKDDEIKALQNEVATLKKEVAVDERLDALEKPAPAESSK
ncbi:MAG: hypothetical protein M3320_02655 [Actinomycetota bacterium]|nr:hypothetical protein [Actinomycetota bacterium]MDQ5807553.1 hypothetical protein [Actinomycetota bacterium]